jgi:hypothetical protein
MKSNEVGTTLKHPETINGNVKNLSKRMKMKDKGECQLPLISTLLASFCLQNDKKKTNFSALAHLLLLCSPNPTLCLQNDTLKPKNRLLIRDCLRPNNIFLRLTILSLKENIVIFSGDNIVDPQNGDFIAMSAILSRCW